MAPSQQIYDFQSDMARHDEEGSGGYRDEEDDYDDRNNIGASGDGSGFGNDLCLYFFILSLLWLSVFATSSNNLTKNLIRIKNVTSVFST